MTALILSYHPLILPYTNPKLCLIEIVTVVIINTLFCFSNLKIPKVGMDCYRLMCILLFSS